MNSECFVSLSTEKQSWLTKVQEIFPHSNVHTYSIASSRYLCVKHTFFTDSGSNDDENATIDEALLLSEKLIPHIPNLLVTLGEYGALMIRRNQVSRWSHFSVTLKETIALWI